VGNDYDRRLLEAVAARRRRLRAALVLGRLRTRRTTSDNLNRMLVGLVLATLLAAGCVGVSFIQQALQAQRVHSATAGGGGTR
jgi:hypothetical protein